MLSVKRRLSESDECEYEDLKEIVIFLKM